MKKATKMHDKAKEKSKAAENQSKKVTSHMVTIGGGVTIFVER